MNKKNSPKWLITGLLLLALSVCTLSIYFLMRGKNKHNQIVQHIDANIAKYGAMYIIDSDNLLYQKIEGASISLEEGEKIHISVDNMESYNDVFIFLIGKNIIQEIGTLDSTTPFSFQASVSGEYVIYDGEKDANITDRVTVEYLWDIKDSKDNLLTPL